MRYCDDEFDPESSTATIGIDFKVSTCEPMVLCLGSGLCAYLLALRDQGVVDLRWAELVLPSVVIGNESA
jgi:hypothetical protein